MLVFIGIESSKEGHYASPMIDAKHGTKDGAEVMKTTIGLIQM